jgi:hypothetical protein
VVFGEARRAPAHVSKRRPPRRPEELFAPAADNWWVERAIAQLGWMRALGLEGGLFFVFGRQH